MNYRKILRKKYIIPLVALLVFGGIFLAKSRRNGEDTVTHKVVKSDLKKTVLATGEVVSVVDLDLGFKSSGIVKRVNVKAGDKVKSGSILAVLDQGQETSALKSAQAALSQARANYQKVVEGATNHEVAVAEAALNAAKVTLQNAQKDLTDTVLEHETLVDNAYRKLLNTDTSAVAINRFDTTATLTVAGTYASLEEGEYTINLQSTGLNSFYAQSSGLESQIAPIIRGTPLALGTRGLYLTFGTLGTLSPVDEWVIRIPNKTSSNYVTNYNAYLAALQTKDSAVSAAEAAVSAASAGVDQKQAELNLKKASARPSELEAALAQVLSAEAQVDTASVNLENTLIRAPLPGTITSVDIKVGEQATALAVALTLEDIGNLYLEANISEANISSLRVGQNLEASFDALGLDKKFPAILSFIDPSSTLISGIVNYKIKATLGQLEEIKPGMTANMTILTAEKAGVLAIPGRAVLQEGDKKFVRVITDSANTSYRNQEVSTGLLGDGGVVEVLSGLTEGQEVITHLGEE